MIARPSALLASILLIAAGCRSDPTEQSFYENVGSAFEECSEREIKYLSAKHNFMLAFEPCGSNNFGDFAWSPDGAYLYFTLPRTHHIMHAAAPTKDTSAVPTDKPVAEAAWLDANRLAIPIAPAAEGADARLQVFDREQRTVLPYTVTGITDMQDLVGSSDTLWFSGVKNGTRGLYQMRMDDGAVTEAFPWSRTLIGGVETFSYTPEQNAVVIGAGDTTGLYDAETGEQRGSWERASGGWMRPSGQWLALEYEGDPINLFYQRAWDDRPDRAGARERERRRADAFVESLPPWYPTELRPPRISVVNLDNGERWDFTGFYGDHFEWYQADDNYVSFVLWGYEGKQLNTNVTLGSLGDRLRAMEAGEDMFGLAKWTDPTTPPSMDPPVAPDASE